MMTNKQMDAVTLPSPLSFDCEVKWPYFLMLFWFSTVRKIAHLFSQNAKTSRSYNDGTQSGALKTPNMVLHGKPYYR